MAKDALPRVLVVLGTRPDAVKLAPVIRELRARDSLDVVVCATAQHREMLDQMLEVFEVHVDHDLGLMQPRQSLDRIVSDIVVAVGAVIDREHPSYVVVQGDTATAWAAALAAFHRQVPVGHVEAGLRSDDRYQPFPEEVYRRLISQLATEHFAPTARAADRLRAERLLPDAEIHLTGNPVVDALTWVVRKAARLPLPYASTAERMLLVTAHRRENLGEPLRRICEALGTLVRRHPDIEIVYPLHRNPEVADPVRSMLGGVARVHLIDPQDYLHFAKLLEACTLVLTDSGGIQEEAPTLHKPVLVLREVTERPEAVDAGTARLVGTDAARIVAETDRLLTDPAAYRSMQATANPFGDGHAARKIADLVEARVGKTAPLADATRR